MSVVIQSDVVETCHRQKAIRDTCKQVICDDEIVTSTRLIRIIGAEQLHALLGVLHRVVRKTDVLHGRPRRPAALAAHSKQDCITNLRVGPGVFQHVAVDDDVACVLKLEQVFYDPVNSGVSGMAHLP